MKKSKKSDVQHAKVCKLLNGEHNKTNNVLSVKNAASYSLQITNLFRILIKKFGLKIG
jgi:hemerythrin